MTLEEQDMKVIFQMEGGRVASHKSRQTVESLARLHGVETKTQNGILYLLDETSRVDNGVRSYHNTWLDASEWTISQMYIWLGY